MCALEGIVGGVEVPAKGRVVSKLNGDGFVLEGHHKARERAVAPGRWHPSTSGGGRAMQVVLLHPELGLGGAERLVVDVALALMHHGHSVTLLCTHHDTGRCFAETLNSHGSRAFWICLRGSALPRSLAGSLSAACSLARNAFLSAVIASSNSLRSADAIVLDQLASPLPLLRALLPRRTRLVYYCHFPDSLLAPHSPPLRRPLRALYRLPLDLAETSAINRADSIIANSHFTSTTLLQTIRRMHNHPLVVHPCVALPERSSLTPSGDCRTSTRLLRSAGVALPQSWVDNHSPTIPFVSINRFEEKKGLQLAVRAFAEALNADDTYRTTTRPYQEHQPSAVLVIAGGFDSRLQECATVLQSLQHEAELHGVRDRTFFLLSFSDKQKESLLDACTALVYTPVNEHFGIAPLEAMARARPVIATNTGGPVESVVDGECGWLKSPQPEAFADAMRECMRDEGECENRGQNGYDRVSQHFAFPAFSERITNAIVHGTVCND